MDSVITIFLPMALFVIMFSLGLGLVVDDFLRVARQPKAFGVGIVCQMVLLPVVAFALAIVFDLSPELSLGLLILALCPGGATSNIMTKIAHGDVALSISLTAVSTMIAIVSMPLLVRPLVTHFLGTEAPTVNVTSLGMAMLALTAVPVIIGMTVRHVSANVATKLEKPIARLAILFVVFVVGAALISNWQMFVENLPRLGPSVVTLNIVMMLLGVALAWLLSASQAEGTAIALETGIQNATLGITIAALIAGNDGSVPVYAIPSGVYGITMFAVCIAFTLWRRRTTSPA